MVVQVPLARLIKKMADPLREQALFVGEIDENINLSFPPTSGEEYIKRVVIEAKHCADVVVADIDRTRLRKATIAVDPLSGCVEAPPWLGPTRQWQEYQIHDFSNVRLYVSQLKDEIQTTKRKWNAPKIELPKIEEKREWIEFCSQEGKSVDPTLNVVFCLNQPTVEQVLEYLVEHVDQQRSIGRDLGKWLYALLVVLEMPLTPDACSCLRSLARACSVIRASNSTLLEVDEIGALNLFICLVARYFRQLDLADP